MCLRSRDRFWDIPVPKIDSAFDNLIGAPAVLVTKQLRNNFASALLLRTWLPYDWTPRSEAYFVFPLAQGTPGKQCGLAATGDYQPSLRSPWLAASEAFRTSQMVGCLSSRRRPVSLLINFHASAGHTPDDGKTRICRSDFSPTFPVWQLLSG